MKSSLKQKRRKIKRAGQKACAFALSIAVMVPSIELLFRIGMAMVVLVNAVWIQTVILWQMELKNRI